MEVKGPKEKLVYRKFWLSVVVVIIVLILGSCVGVWWINQPRLGEILPDYQRATFLKSANASYQQTNGLHGSEINYSCSSGGFGAEDYRAYTTEDTVEQVLAFYRKEVEKRGFVRHESSVSFVIFGKNNNLQVLDLTKKGICFPNVDGKRTFPGYVLMFLDPKIPTEADLITMLLPGVKPSGMVFLVVRGFILYDL